MKAPVCPRVPTANSVVEDVGLRAGRGHGQQAWQGPDPQHLRPPAPQPFRLGGSLPVPQLFSSPVCTTVPTIQSLPGY